MIKFFNKLIFFNILLCVVDFIKIKSMILDYFQGDVLFVERSL